MEGRVLQTAEFVKILCRTLIGSNLPGLPPRNIVLASLETTKWFAQVTQMTIRTLLIPLTRDLLRLNVARNSLSEVPSEALLQLKNLNQLDLSFNKIKVIAENTFAGE